MWHEAGMERACWCGQRPRALVRDDAQVMRCWCPGIWSLELWQGIHQPAAHKGVACPRPCRHLPHLMIGHLNMHTTIHLLSPLQAEKLNGRAAMMGYVLALFVDKLSGASLLDQQNSFLGLLALHLCVFAILIIR